MTYAEIYNHPKNKALKQAINKVENWIIPLEQFEYRFFNEKEKRDWDNWNNLLIRLLNRMHQKYIQQL
jgi:hypothetical protein